MGNEALTSRKKIIATLILLTPGIPEYLTGSSKLVTLFVNPLSFFLGVYFNICLYTCGVLLIREFAVRLNRGWGSILLLGCAYGIMEEGIAVHTFFIPTGGPAANLAFYGRFDGVNWVWVFLITFFHAVYSVALPILLLKLAYPESAKRPLLQGWRMPVVFFIYMQDVFVLNYVVPSQPAEKYYVIFLLTVIVLIIGARILPTDFLSAKGAEKKSPRGAFISGFLVFPLYIFGALIIGGTNGFGYAISPVGDIVIAVIGYLILALYASRSIPREDSNRYLFSLIVGLMIPLFVWAETLTLLGATPLITIVVVTAIYLLLKLRKMIRTSSYPRTNTVA